jgi:hypothetical protein
MIELLSATIFVMMILLVLVSQKCRELSRRVDWLEQRSIDQQLKEGEQ